MKEAIPGFFLHDLVQVIIGATILAIPVGFTDEIWLLSKELPILNIAGIFITSLFFICIFTYYHYHGLSVKKHWGIFLKRTILTYITSFLVVALILTLVAKASFYTDFLITIKRVIIVTLPASMSAAVADTIK